MTNNEKKKKEISSIYITRTHEINFKKLMNVGFPSDKYK